MWAAAWLYRATKSPNYWNYVVDNVKHLRKVLVRNIDGVIYSGGSFAEFGWDTKHAGINILVSKVIDKFLFGAFVPSDSYILSSLNLICL